MKVNHFLDATYLKTATQGNISEAENEQKVIDLVNESIVFDYKLIMVRANYIKMVKGMLSQVNSPVLIGTVIDFPKRTVINKKQIKRS